MVTKVRQASRFGTCDVLGEVINEPLHAYIFRRPDGETAFISKRAPTLHARTVPYVCGLSSPSGTARGGLERSAAPLLAALTGRACASHSATTRWALRRPLRIAGATR